jgi:hypothetical protein
VNEFRKLVAFSAVMVGLTMVAFGAEPQTFQCQLFAVDTDTSQMVVSKGKLGSGIAGDNKATPGKTYIVKVTSRTYLHWQGTKERISLRDIREMNIKQINIPLTICYESSDPGTPKPIMATEIIVMKTDDTKRPE